MSDTRLMIAVAFLAAIDLLILATDVALWAKGKF